jgi:hypothetical protein
MCVYLNMTGGRTFFPLLLDIRRGLKSRAQA